MTGAEAEVAGPGSFGLGVERLDGGGALPHPRRHAIIERRSFCHLASRDLPHAAGKQAPLCESVHMSEWVSSRC